MGKKNIDWVDYAKAIGIILVVYGHVARGVLNAGILVDEKLIVLVDKIIYSFHMPLFFFLSGLFFMGSLTKRGVQGIFVNKINTLIYPYLLWSIIQLSMQIILIDFTNFDKSIDNIYTFLWEPSDHFWYLYTLFVMFVLYALVYYITSSVSFILLLSVLTYFLSGVLATPWSVLNSVYHFGIFFGLGIALSHYKYIQLRLSWTVILTALLIVIHWFYHGFCLDCSTEVKDVMSFLVALVSIITVVAYSKLLVTRDFGWLKKIGSYSLEIYLVHIIFGSGFRIVMQNVFGIENGLFHLFFGTLVGIIVSILFALFARKLGWQFLFASPKSV